MGLSDNYAASLDPRVMQQVTAAIYAELQQIESEASTTPNHAERLKFATQVATGLQNLQPLILSATSFANLTATSTDTTVSDTIATLWNLWSGV